MRLLGDVNRRSRPLRVSLARAVAHCAAGTEGVGADDSVVVPKAATAVNLDPNTHAFVLATAFFTSLMFALAAWLPVVFLLRFLLFG